MTLSELIESDLDLQVAQALGHHIVESSAYGVEVHDAQHGYLVNHKDYSTDWSCGGPLIERERISITLNNKGTWTAWPTPSDPSNQMEGPTPLIAAMRAFVASKR